MPTLTFKSRWASIPFSIQRINAASVSINDIAWWVVQAENQRLRAHFTLLCGHTPPTANRLWGVPDHGREVSRFAVPNGRCLVVKEVHATLQVPVRDHFSRLNERHLKRRLHRRPPGPEVLTEAEAYAEELFLNIPDALNLKTVLWLHPKQ